MKRFVAMLLAVILLMTMAIPALAERTQESARESIARVYVEFNCDIYIGNQLVAEAATYTTGSAVAMGKQGEDVKYFVTNRHVVQPSAFSATLGGRACICVPTEITGHYLVFTELNEKKSVRVVKTSDEADLAVVELLASTDLREPAILREYERGSLNSDFGTVWSIGFPGIGDQLEELATELPSLPDDASVFDGTISKNYATSEDGYLIQHSAKISGGNSGGALVDKNGYLVGINVSYMVEDPDYCNAIDMYHVMNLLDSQKIPYTTVDDVEGIALETILLYCIVGVGALAIVAIVIIILRKRTNSKPNPAPQSAERVVRVDAGALAGKSYKLVKRLNIGRDPQKCAGGIIYPADTKGVSSFHCTLNFDGKTVTVTDNNSSYGTYIDDTKLIPGKPTAMHRGQKLYIGGRGECLSLHSSK